MKLDNITRDMFAPELFDEPDSFDVIDTTSGHVTLRAVNRSGALSAADAYNRNQSPEGRFKVFPHGTYTHLQTITVSQE